jgi:RimJ/RimL family protein N-acetyltransferase
MRFDAAPHIPIAGFRLRPLEAQDVDGWYSYLSMPIVVKDTSWNVKSAMDLKPLVEWYNAEDPSSAIRFAISPVSDHSIVGTIGFHTISAVNRTAEIAYDIHPAYWRRGLGSACCTAVADWGFRERGYVRIQATTMEANVPSIRLLEKCGFGLEGKLRSYRLVRGEPRDFFMFSKLDDGWRAAIPTECA